MMEREREEERAGSAEIESGMDWILLSSMWIDEKATLSFKKYGG